jgi:hypothetical protein
MRSPSSRMPLVVELIGGVYDGELARMPLGCPVCGWPDASVGGAFLSAEGAVYWLSRAEDGDRARAVYAGDLSQLSLEELLSGGNGA